MKNIIIGTLLGTVLVTNGIAGDNRSGLYLGVSAGNAGYNDSDLSVEIGDSKLEDSVSGVKAYLGYQFNNVVGIELGYADYGKYEATSPTSNYSYSATSYSVAANLNE
ncbi:MAG TPA: hypothetical protein EYM48_07525 [Campylobacterales bacterium]|nr:hypothetical protein [Campylobacterales bacterium]